MPAQLPPPLDPAEAEEWMYQGVNAHMIEKFGEDWQERFRTVAMELRAAIAVVSDEDRAEVLSAIERPAGGEVAS